MIESQQTRKFQSIPHNKNKAFFLDRDGVINIDTGYLHKAKDCIFVAGIHGLIQKAKHLGYIIIVVTNQSGIGRGYYTEKDFHRFMSWMNDQLNNNIDDYFFCPFHPKHGIDAYKHDSWDRKPNPGMLEKAIRKHNISPSLSLMIGDKLTDIEAAIAAGIEKPILFTKNRQKTDRLTVISSLAEAQQLL